MVSSDTIAQNASSLHTAPETSYDEWAAQRRAAVTGPQGSLALVLTQWSAAGEEPVSEADARAGYPASTRVTRLERLDIETGEPQEGFRLWQQDSPANLAFEDIERYEYDPAWVIEGRFELVDAHRLADFEHIKDGGATRSHAASGDLVLELEGAEYRLSVLDTPTPEGAQLHLVFGDRTNGVETYAASRFLFIDLPDISGLAEGESVPVVADFNRAVVPPCGFSSQMNCPLPPVQNRLPFELRAGEKVVRYAEGFAL